MLSEAATEEQPQEDTPGKLTAGDILQQERLRRGLSEKAVADKLHITMHYVKALEANAYEKLPGAVFTKGYIRNYALLLELDVDELCSAYDDYNAQLQEGKAEASRQRARRKTDRNRPWVVLSLLVFVGGFAGLWLYNNMFSDDTDSVPAAGDASAAAPVIEQPRETEAATNPPAVQAAVPEVVEQISTSIVDDPVIEAPGLEEPELEEPVVEEPLAVAADDAGQSTDADPLSAAEPADQDDDVSIAASPVDGDQAEIVEVETEIPADSQVQASVEDEADAGPQVIEIAGDGSDVLRVVFSGESWIEVNDSDSNQLYRDLRQDGDVLEITGSAPFGILLGDAPFAQMTLNDTEIDISARIRIDNSARLTVGP